MADLPCKENSVISLQKQTLDDKGLHTILCEVEAMLNSHPLATVSNNLNDLEPLAPSTTQGSTQLLRQVKEY